MIVQKLDFVRGCAVPIIYKGKSLGQTYFVDLFVEKKVVVEVKCVSALLPVHHSQTLTYMRLLNAPAGLLINFNVPKLMDGVKRLINPRVLVGSLQLSFLCSSAPLKTEKKYVYYVIFSASLS